MVEVTQAMPSEKIFDRICSKGLAGPPVGDECLGEQGMVRTRHWRPGAERAVGLELAKTLSVFGLSGAMLLVLDALDRPRARAAETRPVRPAEAQEAEPERHGDGKAGGVPGEYGQQPRLP
jgi:hypothetical protein